ncbi:MAG: ComEC family competence protein [Dysgonamonadaceae bacterium]|jgi:competence protein ComEC|nr:ComEC family competence protein [Dysgonamonadaceae bacterium]
MRSIIGQIPFFRLLIPVFAGILFNRYFPEALQPFYVCAVGIFGMLLSLLLHRDKRFAFRWLFGAGLMCFLFGFTLISYRYHTRQASFSFPEGETEYVAVVTDIPQEKPRSVACNVRVTYPVRKKAVVYFQQTEESFRLAAGDKIVFRATFQPFRNLGNPDDFDYVRFMEMRGFAGSAYIADGKWILTDEKALSPSILAQQMRSKILEFFRSFQLSPDQYAFLSAVTIGDKGSLSDDVKDAFNASGTSHVLAVSGYHVGVIYLILTFLLGFMGGSRRQRVIKQTMIIVALWVYVFITGLPISVIRSAIMLTVFCMGNIVSQKGFTYNTMAIAAFLILIFNPCKFFDLGFQLSFASVFSILYFQPKLSRFFNPKNKYLRYVWQLFIVSLAAQIAVFPIVLYYFGTFPTYFFIANVLVVPLTGVIMYAFLPLLVFAGLKLPFLYEASKWAVEFLINLVLDIVYFIESLPCAQLSGNHISMFQMLVIFAFLYAAIRFLQGKSGRMLLASLGFVCIYLSAFIYSTRYATPARWVVFNKPGYTETGVFWKGKRILHAPDENRFVPNSSKKILRLSENKYAGAFSKGGLPVDVLVLSHDATFSLSTLQELFRPEIVVLDSSLPRSAANRMRRESERLNIKLHDVSQAGAFSVDF